VRVVEDCDRESATRIISRGELGIWEESLFECVACGLKISGLSYLSACGLGDTYTGTFTYDAAEYGRTSIRHFGNIWRWE
jgi:ribosomal protein L37AE/L43A